MCSALQAFCWAYAFEGAYSRTGCQCFSAYFESSWSKSLTSGCTPVKSSSLRPVFQVLQRHDITGVSDPYPMPSSRSATSHRFSTKLAILTGLPGRTWPYLPIDSLPISGGWMIRGKAKVSFSNAMFLLIFVGLPEASRIHLVHASDWPGAAHQYCKVDFKKKAKRHQLCICYTHQGSLQVSDTILNILTWKNKGNLYTFPFPGAFFLFSCPGLLTGFFDSFVLPVMVSIGPYRCVPLKVEKTVWTVWTAWTMKE